MSITIITILCICITCCVGIFIGSLKFRGIGLGVGGVLFALGIIGAIFYSRRMKQNGEVPFEITHKL